MAINLEFLKNGVDAENQVAFPYYFDGADKDKADFRVMFIGNSITIHEPKKEIGWNKKCGMAASDIDHDYVHIVYRHILEKHPKTSILVFNGGNWEKDYTNEAKLNSILSAAKEFKPDIVIVRIGENFNREYLKTISPLKGFIPLATGLKRICDKVYITSLFWHHDLIDSAIKEVSDQLDIRYIKLDDLGEDRSNMAFDQYGETIYSSHPGDLGMERIAERIIRAIDSSND